MRTSRFSLSLLLTLTAFGGCRNDDPPAPTPLKATLHRTSYGVPHIQADGYRSLGAGIGYAQAQDAVCILADQFLKVRGERATPARTRRCCRSPSRRARCSPPARGSRRKATWSTSGPASSFRAVPP
uniref:penicillin acylase family protein n=1 Tax=Corallococcus coralloides TaxID=184914 RepID=UPI00196AAC45|nr:penicillin acylase family protein [Corallococcus coralloides]